MFPVQAMESDMETIKVDHTALLTEHKSVSISLMTTCDQYCVC